MTPDGGQAETDGRGRCEYVGFAAWVLRRVTWFWVAGRKRKNIINVRSIEESGLTFFSARQGHGWVPGAI